MKKLLEAYTSPILGKFTNRVVMSAMTRGFADKDHQCVTAMAEYYERRAIDGVALILTEGIIIHPSADGYNNVPHLHTSAQAESWKQVTDRVHAAGSVIFAQLWHCGRISHSDFTGGEAPVSSTSRAAEGHNRQNDKPFGEPRALDPSDMPKIHEMYLNAAANAFTAGFDGVELHIGHGYLVDQFFDSRVNDRTDQYGGSVENRCRMALELIDIFIQKYGAEKVMVRISPSRMMSGLYDWPDLEEMLDYFIPQADKLGLRAIDLSCGNADYFETSGRIIRMIRPNWPHFLMGGASLTVDQASAELEAGHLDMVTWGRDILANPDFVSRIKNGDSLKKMTGEDLKVLH